VVGADIDDTPASRHSERLTDAGRGARKSSVASVSALPADALAYTPVYAVNDQQIEPAFRSSPSACPAAPVDQA
jgi:hypothetical protein